MFKRILVILVALSLLIVSIIALPVYAAGSPHVLLTTSTGKIELELDAQKAPVSTKNFVDYVNSGYYNKTIFHRVIPGFMIQGGGLLADMQLKVTEEPIKNEADNGLRNLRGTIAMARTSDKDSATSQFFINVANNNFLDYSQTNAGYAVFGKVIAGMDVVDKISQMKTSNKGPHQNVPEETVTILSVEILP